MNDYIRVYHWMVEKYGLKGNDLLVFAFVHFYTVCTKEHGWMMSIAKLAVYFGLAEPTVRRVLYNLRAFKLVEKFRIWDHGTPRVYLRTTCEEKGYND